MWHIAFFDGTLDQTQQMSLIWQDDPLCQININYTTLFRYIYTLPRDLRVSSFDVSSKKFALFTFNAERSSNTSIFLFLRVSGV